jgi:hypothetical protein
MKFTLIYDGDLPASGNSSKPEAASAIRNDLHHQLADLWDGHVVFRQLARTARTTKVRQTLALSPKPSEEHYAGILRAQSQIAVAQIAAQLRVEWHALHRQHRPRRPQLSLQLGRASVSRSIVIERQAGPISQTKPGPRGGVFVLAPPVAKAGLAPQNPLAPVPASYCAAPCGRVFAPLAI